MAGSSKKVIYSALAGNFMVACTKFVAAMIADLDRRIKAAYPQAKRIFVEAESLQVHIARDDHQ